MNSTNKLSIEILNSCKAYKKADKCIQNSINKSLKMLKVRIESYAQNNISFNQIFNDDTVKYDVYNNGQSQLYALKGRDNKLQLRLLYTVKIDPSSLSIILVDYEMKKSNDKKYIEKFMETARKFSLGSIEPMQISI